MAIKLFECEITKNKIKYTINESDNECYIEFINVNYERIKGFFLLLKTSIDKIKQMNINKVKQVVVFNDWIQNLKDKTSFEYVTHSNETDLCVIECDIDDVLENIGIGFGVNTILKF